MQHQEALRAIDIGVSDEISASSVTNKWATSDDIERVFNVQCIASAECSGYRRISDSVSEEKKNSIKISIKLNHCAAPEAHRINALPSEIIRSRK